MPVRRITTSCVELVILDFCAPGPIGRLYSWRHVIELLKLHNCFRNHWIPIEVQTPTTYLCIVQQNVFIWKWSGCSRLCSRRRVGDCLDCCRSYRSLSQLGLPAQVRSSAICCQVDRAVLSHCGSVWKMLTVGSTCICLKRPTPKPWQGLIPVPLGELWCYTLGPGANEASPPPGRSSCH